MRCLLYGVPLLSFSLSFLLLLVDNTGYEILNWSYSKGNEQEGAYLRFAADEISYSPP